MSEELNDAVEDNRANLAEAQEANAKAMSTTTTTTPEPAPKPPVTDAKVTDYGVTKSIFIIESLLEKGALPSKGDCETLLDMESDEKTPLRYTQVLVRQLLDGSGMPNEKQLNKLLTALKA